MSSSASTCERERSYRAGPPADALRAIAWLAVASRRRRLVHACFLESKAARTRGAALQFNCERQGPFGGCERARVVGDRGRARSPTCLERVADPPYSIPLREAKRPFAEPLGRLLSTSSEIPDELPRSASLPRNDNGSAIAFTHSGERVIGSREHQRSVGPCERARVAVHPT
jgi:hypothetical protein